eukprot:TRINITY_DN14059_c0_g1_i1.p1 TRINITY_DN14059_c0_g1~~TRINITY_DN14059_c0_g1_i1.p1  ORF type:complete len:420 (+),score=66.23 TRINITY_DN14059_c0_g1_i1:290-1549(+)
MATPQNLYVSINEGATYLPLMGLSFTSLSLNQLCGRVLELLHLQDSERKLVYQEMGMKVEFIDDAHLQTWLQESQPPRQLLFVSAGGAGAEVQGRRPEAFRAMLVEGGITVSEQVVAHIIKYQPDRLNAVLAAGSAQEAVELYNDVRCLPWTATRLNVRQDFGIVIDGGSLPIVTASRAQFLRAWRQGRRPHVLKVPRDASKVTVNREVGVWQAVMDTWASAQDDADIAGVSTPPGVVGPLTCVPFTPGQHSAGKGGPVVASAGVLMPMYAGTLEDVPMPGTPDCIWACARTLRSVLNIMHQAQIAHCDVKASNVFVDFRGEFHLGDFGAATPFGQRALECSTEMLPRGCDDLFTKKVGGAVDQIMLAATLLKAMQLLPHTELYTTAEMRCAVQRVQHEDLQASLADLIQKGFAEAGLL